MNREFFLENLIYPLEIGDKKIVFLSARDDEALKFKLKKHYDREIFFVSAKTEEILERLKNYASNDVVKIFDDIITQAIIKNATDVHIESATDKILIRFRIDGALTKIAAYEKSILPRLMSRIKLVSGLDISIKRVPQDGRFSFDFKGRKIDIRVATAPTSEGEKAVLRILDINRVDYTFDGIGLVGKNLEKILNLISQPAGLILCCGPTSSGKTSTLYTILKKLNKRDINICTIEDPVEYKIQGVNQMEVSENTGLTFEKGLKSILRMDPDMIMIGEIRDIKTAKIAITSSITGHLVLSTLHTQSSPASVNRLIDMGIEPYLVSAGLIGAISQRLIRRLCDNCKVEKKINIQGEIIDSYEACGCENCNDGYVGRIAVFEIMTVDDQLRQAISKNPDILTIKEICKNKSMSTLKDEILELIRNGLTTADEFYKNILTIGDEI